jgi:hypothetical protein
MRGETVAPVTSTTFLVPECQNFIEKCCRARSDKEFCDFLDSVKVWFHSTRTELVKWTDIITRCDKILTYCSFRVSLKDPMRVDYDEEYALHVGSVLRFSSLLFENTFSRSIFPSTDKVLRLLETTNLDVLLCVLRFLFVVSKHSDFLDRYSRKYDISPLRVYIKSIVEAWDSFDLTASFHQLCLDCTLPAPDSFVTYLGSDRISICVDRSEKLEDSLDTALGNIRGWSTKYAKYVTEYAIAKSKALFIHRLQDKSNRIKCALIRVLVISIANYAKSLGLDSNIIAYESKVLCEIVKHEKTGPQFLCLKAEALRSLASIFFLKQIDLIKIISAELSLANAYGTISTIMNTAHNLFVSDNTPELSPEETDFYSALFSFVYHAGGNAREIDSDDSKIFDILVDIVANCRSDESLITFITRSVRIIDNLVSFNTSLLTNARMELIAARFPTEIQNAKISLENGTAVYPLQNMALIKSLLNFMRRAIMEMHLGTVTMKQPTIEALLYVFENAQHFGPSLFHPCYHLIISFISQETNQINMIHETGLSQSILNCLMANDLMVSREIIQGLPNLISALSLNNRGLELIQTLKPMERIIRLIFSAKFLVTTSKKKDEMDKATLVITGGLNDLIDHQPSLAREIFTHTYQILGDLLKALEEPDIQCYDAEKRKSTMLYNFPYRFINEDEEMEDIDSPQGASNDATPDYQEELNQSLAADFEMESEPSKENEYRTYYSYGGVKILPLYENLNLVVKIINVVTKRNNKQLISLLEEIGIFERLVEFLITKFHPFGVKNAQYPKALAELFKRVSSTTKGPKTLAIEVMLKTCTEFIRIPTVSQHMETQMNAHLQRDEVHAISRLTALFEFASELFTPKTNETFSNRDDLLEKLLQDKSTTEAFVNSLLTVHRIFISIKLMMDLRKTPSSASLFNMDLSLCQTSKEDFTELISSASASCENIITALMSTHFTFIIQVIRSVANIVSKKEYISNCVNFGSIVFEQICQSISSDLLNQEITPFKSQYLAQMTKLVDKILSACKTPYRSYLPHAIVGTNLIESLTEGIRHIGEETCETSISAWGQVMKKICYLDDFPLLRDPMVDKLRVEMFNAIKSQIMSYPRNKAIPNPKVFIPDFISVIIEILRASKRKEFETTTSIDTHLLNSKDSKDTSEKMETDEVPQEAVQEIPLKEATIVNGIIDFLGIIMCMTTTDDKITLEVAKLITQFINTEPGDQYIKIKLVQKRFFHDIPRLCKDVLRPNRVTDQLMLKGNLHLMALLMMEMPTSIMMLQDTIPTATAICELLNHVVEKGEWYVPYLPYVLFWIETWLKKHRLESRRALFNRHVDSLEWSFRSVRATQYQIFSESNQELLTKAFKDGKTSLALTEKRNLRMMVDLTKMVYRTLDRVNEFHSIKIKAKINEGTSSNHVIKFDESLKPGNFEEQKVIEALVKIMQANTMFAKIPSHETPASAEDGILPAEFLSNDETEESQKFERTPLPYELVYSTFSLLIQVFEIRNTRKSFIELGGVHAILHQELEKFTPEITLVAFVAFTRSMDIGIQSEKEIEATIQAALREHRYNNSIPYKLMSQNDPFDKSNFFYRMTPLFTHPQFFDIYTKNTKASRGNTIEMASRGMPADFVNIKVESYKEKLFEELIPELCAQAKRPAEVFRTNLIGKWTAVYYLTFLTWNYRSSIKYIMLEKNRDVVGHLIESFIKRTLPFKLYKFVLSFLSSLVICDEHEDAANLVMSEIRNVLQKCIKNWSQSEFTTKVSSLANLVLQLKDVMRCKRILPGRPVGMTGIKAFIREQMLHAFTQALAYISQKDSQAKGVNDVIVLLREITEVVNTISPHNPQDLGLPGNGSSTRATPQAPPHQQLLRPYYERPRIRTYAHGRYVEHFLEPDWMQHARDEDRTTSEEGSAEETTIENATAFDQVNEAVDETNDIPIEFSPEAQSFEIQHRFLVYPYMNQWHPLHLPPTDLTDYSTTVPIELRETNENPRRLPMSMAREFPLEIPSLAPEMRMSHSANEPPPRIEPPSGFSRRKPEVDEYQALRMIVDKIPFYYDMSNWALDFVGRHSYQYIYGLLHALVLQKYDEKKTERTRAPVVPPPRQQLVNELADIVADYNGLQQMEIEQQDNVTIGEDPQEPAEEGNALFDAFRNGAELEMEEEQQPPTPPRRRSARLNPAPPPPPRPTVAGLEAEAEEEGDEMDDDEDDEDDERDDENDEDDTEAEDTNEGHHDDDTFFSNGPPTIAEGRMQEYANTHFPYFRNEIFSGLTSRFNTEDINSIARQLVSMRFPDFLDADNIYPMRSHVGNPKKNALQRANELLRRQVDYREIEEIRKAISREASYEEVIAHLNEPIKTEKKSAEEMVLHSLRSARQLIIDNEKTKRATQAPEPRYQELDENIRCIIGENLRIPEGLDPVFIAELPPEIREQAIEQHLVSNPPIAQVDTSQETPMPLDPTNLNIDFLNTLPSEMRNFLINEVEFELLELEDNVLMGENPLNFRQQIFKSLGDREIRSLPKEIIAEVLKSKREVMNSGTNQTFSRHSLYEQQFETRVKTAQIFDQKSIDILLALLLYRVPSLTNELEHLFIEISQDIGSCDYIIWALISMIQTVVQDVKKEEIDEAPPLGTWLDSFTDYSGHVLRFTSTQKIAVTEISRFDIIYSCIQILSGIANRYPINFQTMGIYYKHMISNATKVKVLPDNFWKNIRDTEHLVPQNGKVDLSPRKLVPMEIVAIDDIEESAIFAFLQLLNTKYVKMQPRIQKKIIQALGKQSADLPSHILFHCKKDVNTIQNICELFEPAFRLCLVQPKKNNDNWEQKFMINVLNSFYEGREYLLNLMQKLIVERGLNLVKLIQSTVSQISEQGFNLVKHGKLLMLLSSSNGDVKSFAQALQTMHYVRSKMILEDYKQEMVTQKAQKEGLEKVQHDPNVTASFLFHEKELDKKMLKDLRPLWESMNNLLEVMMDQAENDIIRTMQYSAEALYTAHMFCVNRHVMKRLFTGDTSENLEDAKIQVQTILHFSERYRELLNYILRKTKNSQIDELANVFLYFFPRLLDFDVRRRYFNAEVYNMRSSMGNGGDIHLKVRRQHVFSDSYQSLHRHPAADWFQRFSITFKGEQGQDAGGLLREWYTIITREIFNPNYALFITAPGDRVAYMINKMSHVNQEHLSYFTFIGHFIAKAVFDNKALDCYFTKAFYKHILGVPINYKDIEYEDPEYFKSLQYLQTHPVSDLGSELTFTQEIDEFGILKVKELIPNGSEIIVTDENKDEYVSLMCQMKMTESIRAQLDSFLNGFYDIIPRHLISIFQENELELLIAGLPEIDLDDWYNNTEYKGFNKNSEHIRWFWKALRSFTKEDLAQFMQFVTGTTRVPLGGFANLEGMSGVQKFTIHMDTRSNDRLPSAHTCFNQIDLPAYESYEQMKKNLLLACRECNTGFAFA